MSGNMHSSLWQDVRRDILHNPIALAGSFTLLLIFLFCTLGTVL